MKSIKSFSKAICIIYIVKFSAFHFQHGDKKSEMSKMFIIDERFNYIPVLATLFGLWEENHALNTHALLTIFGSGITRFISDT